MSLPQWNVLVRFLSLSQNMWQTTYERKDLIWLRLSELPGYGQLVPSLWACGKLSTIAGTVCWWKPTYLIMTDIHGHRRQLLTLHLSWRNHSFPEDAPVLEWTSSLHVPYLIHRRPVVKRKPQYIGDGECQVSIKDTKKRGGSLN